MAVAAGALVFTGAAAFTNSLDFSSVTNTTVGYGALSVSGAKLDTISYNLDTAGDQIDSVDFTVEGDTTGSTVSIGFNAGARTSCSGSYTTGPDTSYTCSLGGSPVDTDSITSTDIVFQ